jgi:hypothetical protein
MSLKIFAISSITAIAWANCSPSFADTSFGHHQYSAQEVRSLCANRNSGPISSTRHQIKCNLPDGTSLICIGVSWPGPYGSSTRWLKDKYVCSIVRNPSHPFNPHHIPESESDPAGPDVPTSPTTPTPTINIDGGPTKPGGGGNNCAGKVC